jgi:DNA-binding MarR family transcriptional regulator
VIPRAEIEGLTLGQTSSFMRSLWRFNHALERASRRMENRRGVTLQQRLVVRFIGKYPGTTASQLSAYFHLDPGTISASIARLEHKGLIERRRTNRDRRRVTLGLTADGRALDGESGEDIDRALETLMDACDTHDGAGAQVLLERMAGELERMVGD